MEGAIYRKFALLQELDNIRELIEKSPDDMVFNIDCSITAIDGRFNAVLEQFAAEKKEEARKKMEEAAAKLRKEQEKTPEAPKNPEVKE